MTRLDIVILGLSLSSSWGNGHATTYRSLIKGLNRNGHRVTFLECDRPWYAAHRDLTSSDDCALIFYDEPEDLAAHRVLIRDADAVIVGSYVPEGAAVGRFVQGCARGVTAFYDIDTPVTLAALDAGTCPYLDEALIRGYDLYLSFTGGPVLDRLVRQHGAHAAHALYCSVDEEAYAPEDAAPRYDLGYLGTYSPDRQPMLERLLLEPAREAPSLSFVVAGPQYPADIAWPVNVTRVDHVPPARHPHFYSACRFTLNLTRADMVRLGFSPSVRLFEAAACGAPIISDSWAGLEQFLEPGREIAIAGTTEDVLTLLSRTGEEARLAQARAARARILSAHTARHRAAELEKYIRGALHQRRPRSERVVA